MPELMVLCERVIEGLDLVHDRISVKPWDEHSPNAFNYTLKYTIGELENVAGYLELIKSYFRGTAPSKEIELGDYLKEFSSEITFLKTNQRLEQSRAKEVMGRGEMLLQESKAPELYGGLEERVLQLLLKTRHLMQRLQIHASNEGIKARLSQKDVMQLLEEQGKELEELKEKYAELREQTLNGKISRTEATELEEKTVELKEEVQKKKLVGLNELDLNRLKNLINFFEKHPKELDGKELVDLHNYFYENKRDLEKFFEKNSKLINLLKKERDQARKLFLDKELEYEKKRAEYSIKLSELKEKENSFKEELKNELRIRLSRLRAELQHQRELVEELKESNKELRKKTAKKI